MGTRKQMRRNTHRRHDRRNDPMTDAERQDEMYHETQHINPSPAEIADALDDLATLSPETEHPDIDTLRTLSAADMDTVRTDGVHLIDYAIQKGKPRNGALRSDDHLSHLELNVPRRCPEDDCLAVRASYEYSAHHHVAGYERMTCEKCGHKYVDEKWG